LIEQTDAFEDLTGYVWKAFSANKEHLKSSEIKWLGKKIANKAGISVKDLEQDDEEKKDINHRSIALAVIASFGQGNLVESLGKIWRWNER
jgi:putative DNA primase/helicase